MKNDIKKLPIVEKCVGCTKVVLEGENNVCSVYIVPEAKWRLGLGKCPMASHIKKEVKESSFVDPLKASKAKYKKVK